MAQTGWTGAAGQRSQGLAPPGEVQLVPSAGRGWVGPTAATVPAWGPWKDGTGQGARALVLSGDGALMPSTLLTKASGQKSCPLG